MKKGILMKLKLKAGNVYFISDSFFEKVNDPFLKINYKTTKRPHYFAFQDTITSYENIVKKKQEQHKPTDTIKIIKIQNQKAVLLFQDMFPITDKYISEPYIRGGQLYYIADPKLISNLERTARKIVTLLHRGIKFTPTQPDINRIEKLMIAELQEKS